jgi:transposase
MSKAELSREGQEWRRLRAWNLWQQGWKQKDIAIALGVTKGAVSQWTKRGREEGAEGLRQSLAKGAKPRISDEQRTQLPTFLALGAEAFGYRGDVWTGQRVAELIKRVFGISYHPDHCSRILRQIGWSVQKPIERATQRNEEAIKDWKEQQWPALQKKPKSRSERLFL